MNIQLNTQTTRLLTNAQPSLTLAPMCLEHIAGVERLASPSGYDPLNYSWENLPHVIRKFPEGQWVALVDGKVVSYAITMRTRRTPTEAPLTWYEMIGGVTLNNHDPNGDWLYGVDFAVDPNYRKHGIGTQMYQVRFDLVKRLNLRGFYAGGMLMGYYRYQHQMTAREYGEKVIRGELEDPTVTMQMRRGFKPRAVIEHYVDYPQAGHAAILIEWANPQYANPHHRQPQYHQHQHQPLSPTHAHHSPDFTRIFISQSSVTA